MPENELIPGEIAAFLFSHPNLSPAYARDLLDTIATTIAEGIRQPDDLERRIENLQDRMDAICGCISFERQERICQLVREIVTSESDRIYSDMLDKARDAIKARRGRWAKLDMD